MTDDAARPPRRGAGRPRVAVLNRERITDEALRLVDRKGAGALTIQALADRLGVVPSAIYNHAASRAVILGWIQERLVREVDVSGFGPLPWRAATERWAWSYLRVLRAHRECVAIYAHLPIRDTPEATQMYQRVIVGFQAAGFPPPEVFASISAIEQLVFGGAIDSLGPEDVYAPEAPGIVAQAYALHRRRLVEERVLVADRAFELALGLLLDGLTARYRIAPAR
ncbi:TetR/AcrR family transcriptional regulator [Agromyces sp. S2-1-8]|uniref:TetR/AcrR family transcriptional regulator n=1 Tax=Agromyces sp. S2-1-8 TaxID=2897180 RepID=UPI001E57B9E2|nr:TetR/AcrR family transcriptional regulator C-terminal domain-containing protein [Agromyces sp. S2-1-8]MCD5348191.1 TetR/AcrR family transcriptional regulator C-terminal domain-containing protein [Agromyces sp. S2-1-8]